jgi:hypothetical protein
MYTRPHECALPRIRPRATLHAHGLTAQNHTTRNNPMFSTLVVARHTRQPPRTCIRAHTYVQGFAIVRSRALHAHGLTAQNHTTRNNPAISTLVVARRTRQPPSTCTHAPTNAHCLAFVRSRALHAHLHHKRQPHHSKQSNVQHASSRASHAPTTSHMHTRPHIRAWPPATDCAPHKTTPITRIYLSASSLNWQSSRGR